MSSTINIKVLFEDSHLLIIDKPSGVVVNISKTSPQNTVQNFLQDKLKVEPNPNSEFSQRTGIVHRLDKGTSGVLVVAKDENTFQFLKDQFMKRSVKKSYVALAYGEIKDKIIEIDAPIKRNPKNRVKMAVHGEGKDAFTRFEVVEIVDLGDLRATLVNVFPKTGRTHQIRVHLSAINHPIIGDATYLSRIQQERVGERFSRLMLHAIEICFSYPKEDEEVCFKSKLPKEFVQNPFKN